MDQSEPIIAIESLIAEKNWDQLRARLMDHDPADIAAMLMAVPDEEDVVIFRMLPKEVASQVFSYLPANHQEALLNALSHEQMRSVLSGMSADDQTRLLEELPGEVTQKILKILSPEEREQARELLGYPLGTAGRYMTPDYVALSENMTAGEALEFVKQNGKNKETLNILYVVDAGQRFVEEVSLGGLVLAPNDQKITSIDGRQRIAIKVDATSAEVVSAFEKYDRVALPVVDDEEKMLGLITVDDVLDVVSRNTTREIQKLGGSEALDAPYFEVGFWPMVNKRGGWLAALFLGEMLTATAMGYFEVEIEKAAVVALFVPLIISSGGNSGSQATSIIIRSLALQEFSLGSWFRVFSKELASGLALGTFLGLVGFIRILLWYYLGWHTYEGHPYLMGFTVWGSLVGVVTFGSVVGSMLPFILRKLGFDPATASAPFVATLVDVTGLIIYFSVALVLLKGTLL